MTAPVLSQPGAVAAMKIVRSAFVLVTARGCLGPSCAAAAQRANVATVALLTAFSAADGTAVPPSFLQRLGELGWVEGRNLRLVRRHAESLEQQQQISAEMEREKVDVVLACSPCAFYVAPSGPAPIRGIPIVFAGVSDPVGARMVGALNHPGGNMTGLSNLGAELNVKRLQLLKEALPHVDRVAILVQKDHPLRDRMVVEVSEAASKLKLTLRLYEIAGRGLRAEQQRAAIEQAFATMTADHVQAVFALQGPHFARERKLIADLGLQYRLPGSLDFIDYVRLGGFMAYGVDSLELYRRAADYVDKILRGATAADLPVEQPTKFSLLFNAKTAKALGLTVPSSLLLRANQVIE